MSLNPDLTLFIHTLRGIGKEYAVDDRALYVVPWEGSGI